MHISVAGRVLVPGAAVLLLASCSSGPAAPRPAADGLRHTAITVSGSSGSCGRGWTQPRAGAQVFDLHNTGTGPAEVYLAEASGGAVLGEIEGLAPGATRPLRATVGAGRYVFRCLPDDADAVSGPAVRVPGHARGGPAVRPVDEHELIPPTLGYQKWVAARTRDLVAKTGTLRDAVHAGDLPEAKRRWLDAHLLYERMGAAYGAFGDLDASLNGARPPAGFHLLEKQLWHGGSAADRNRTADRLLTDARALRTHWAQARMDPLELGLRAHEIVENTVQFELTGRTDFGSRSNLATAQANLDGTRTALHYLHPVIAGRYPQLAATERQLAKTAADLRKPVQDRTPVSGLPRAQRERINADFGDLVEKLAPIAAICDVRRTS